MKYYIWLDADGQPASKAWRYEDEAERMAEEDRPPTGAVILQSGTKQQLKELLGLHDEDFVGG
jgi:hypothetical protein